MQAKYFLGSKIPESITFCRSGAKWVKLETVCKNDGANHEIAENVVSLCTAEKARLENFNQVPKVILRVAQAAVTERWPLHISSSCAKILRETNFRTREIPRSGSKGKDGKEKEQKKSESW